TILYRIVEYNKQIPRIFIFFLNLIREILIPFRFGFFNVFRIKILAIQTIEHWLMSKINHYLILRF
ncbi:hypothetical protein CK516_08680, partial [Nostoc sp. 'Peltigera malacea cyanobiont' DB3992]